ncbi:MAG: methyltransferase domain-containing protein [Methylomonas sp.]|nr:methyltransferase domain-containing protein [Methylomonas sp.]PPD21792.1 MAG: SAM-dependent methyltransferase [Methylomonas sp.]PPD27478.1 MAG: SAM-dependent methyltransferase [Methylomonas sp.]PPD39461.1 MAG: SAM-dependent methyltransferase [Methylomonas sp.]PPD42261.1 MAG: SAM-dependent methyltransferase [Methylomonas sp.]
MHVLEPGKDYRDLCLRSGGDLDPARLQADAVRHYDDCYNDYLFAWSNRDNLALHYGYWDDTSAYKQHQALLNKNQALYDKAGIQPTDHVLDAGCGIGGSSIWMAKHHGNRVTGITISSRQAGHAARHARRHGVAANVDFQVADFCATAFDAASFDVVWALESSCHALNKADFLKEAWRLLRPGGRIVVCDGFLLKREFDDDQWQAVVTCLNGWAVPNLCSRDEFNGLLTQQGFDAIVCHDITAQTWSSVQHMYKVARRLKSVQTISQWLGLRSPAQTANYLVGLAQYRLFTENLTEYCIFTARKSG